MFWCESVTKGKDPVMADDNGYGCAALVFSESEENTDDEPTQVTRLLQDLDDCLESSRKNLKDARDKADRLQRHARRNRKRIRETLAPPPSSIPEGDVP